MTWKPQKPPFTNFKRDVFRKAGEVAEFIYQIGEYENLRKPSKEILLEEIHSKDFKAKVAYLKDCLLRYRQLTGYGQRYTTVTI